MVIMAEMLSAVAGEMSDKENCAWLKAQKGRRHVLCAAGQI
jgi:hypothetical protein